MFAKIDGDGCEWILRSGYEFVGFVDEVGALTEIKVRIPTANELFSEAGWDARDASNTVFGEKGGWMVVECIQACQRMSASVGLVAS